MPRKTAHLPLDRPDATLPARPLPLGAPPPMPVPYVAINRSASRIFAFQNA